MSSSMISYKDYLKESYVYNPWKEVIFDSRQTQDDLTKVISLIFLSDLLAVLAQHFLWKHCSFLLSFYLQGSGKATEE